MIMDRLNTSIVGVRPLVISLLGLFLTVNVLCTPATAQSNVEEPSFSAALFNIEAPVKETFRYQTTLQSGQDRSKTYELKADVPKGWRATFKIRGKRVASVKTDGDKKEDINIEFNPAHEAAPGKYKIPTYAISGNDTLLLDLEAVVTGSYDIELTTPSGLLSGDITEGRQKEIDLVVKNTGSLPLENINLSSQTPTKWEVTFTPSEIERLGPGETTDVVAKVKVPEKTLVGDYVSKFTAKVTEAKSTASYRMTVKTSALAGWTGLSVILAAIGMITYLIRKFGRR